MQNQNEKNYFKHLIFLFFYTNTVVNILKKSAFYLVNVTFAPL